MSDRVRLIVQYEHNGKTTEVIFSGNRKEMIAMAATLHGLVGVNNITMETI